MSVLKHILEKNSIVSFSSTTKEGAINELIDLVVASNDIGDRESLHSEILRREDLMSTGIGLGIAVPHVRLEGVDDIIAVMGVNSSGITDYESMDDLPVKIIVLIIAGKGEHLRYIQFLSKVVAFLKEDSNRTSIIEDPSPANLSALLNKN